LAPGASAAEPIFPGKEWAERPPAEVGLDAGRLQSFSDYVGGRGCVIRHGYMVHHWGDVTRRADVASACKPWFTHFLLAAAEEGKIASLDEKVTRWEPRLAELNEALGHKDRDITWRHLANQCSSYGVAERPGSAFDYSDYQIALLADTLFLKVYDATWDKVDREVLGPRLTDVLGCQDKPTLLAFGDSNRPGRLAISVRDFARFGLLYLRQGKWRDRQIIAEKHAKLATTSPIEAKLPRTEGRTAEMLSGQRSLGGGANQTPHFGAYSWLWWTNGIDRQGVRMWPAAPHDLYGAFGHGGRRALWVMPSLDIVVSYNDSQLDDGRLHGWTNGEKSKTNEAMRQLAQAVVQSDAGQKPPQHAAERNKKQTAADPAPAAEKKAAKTPDRLTAVSIRGEQFLINGKPTYEGRTWRGHKIEGLLLNSRMVQGIFDDLNPSTRDRWAYPDKGRWDADRNTREFIAAMPDWRKHGLLAVTLNLQGGSPQGYSKAQPWHNSAIIADGRLRADYMNRLELILNRADELGIVVILGLFYFGQDQRLADEEAVKKAVDNAIDWLKERGYRHVLIEVNNECNVRYDHAILGPERVHELMERVKERDGRLLVGTSYGGGTIPGENVVRASDFLLLHGNGVSDPKRIADMVVRTRKVPGYRPMPILFNEDDHFDFDKPENNFTAAVGQYASWGYFDFRLAREGFDEGYQSVPVNWGISSERKKGFFRLLAEITGAAEAKK
jgi:hypothetical protein